jgi:photosystem II stability/assembly factor-like uncharacterized protein/sugar lactone lactonase YvrE
MSRRRWFLLLAPMFALCIFGGATIAKTIEVSDVFFLDDMHGWLITSGANSELLHTSDGGITWIHIPNKIGFVRMKFADAKTGMALGPADGGGYGIFRSDDAGENWKLVNVIRQESLMILDFGFATRDDVFLAGQLQAGLGWVGELVDGWRTLRLRQDVPIQYGTSNVFVDGTSNLWIIGKLTIVYSHDSGKTWQDQTSNSTPRIDLGFAGASVAGGYAWLTDPEDIFRTTDYGKSWTRIWKQRDPWTNFSSISFMNPSDGCAVGDSSSIFCTHDGGTTWTSAKVFDRIPGGMPYRSSLFLFNSLHGWAVVNTELYKTLDGGRTFVKAFSDIPEDSSQPQSLRTAINGPSQLSFDEKSNLLYIYEMMEGRILKYDVARGSVEPVFDPTELPKVAPLRVVKSFTSAGNGELYVGDFSGHLRRYDVATKSYISEPSSDLNQRGGLGVGAIVIDRTGNAIFSATHAIFTWNPKSNQVEFVAGNHPGFGGDGALATDADLHFPEGVAVDGKDDIFIADYQNCRVRRIDHSTRIIQTIAGDGKCESRGDGGLATSASLNYPSSLAIDNLGNIFVVEGGRVKRIDGDGIITNYAGNGKNGFGGDGGPANEAMIGPSGIAVDGEGNLYIAEFSNNRIRRVDAKTHVITTVAGNGKPFRIDSVM